MKLRATLMVTMSLMMKMMILIITLRVKVQRQLMLKEFLAGGRWMHWQGLWLTWTGSVSVMRKPGISRHFIKPWMNLIRSL